MFCTPRRKPETSCNRGSCRVHSSNGPGLLASGHFALFPVWSLTILGVTWIARHSVANCHVTGQTEEFLEVLAAVSWSESEADGSNEQGCTLVAVPPAPRLSPLSWMIDSQENVNQNVICHAHTVLRNYLNNKMSC